MPFCHIPCRSGFFSVYCFVNEAVRLSVFIHRRRPQYQQTQMVQAEHKDKTRKYPCQSSLSTDTKERSIIYAMLPFHKNIAISICSTTLKKCSKTIYVEKGGGLIVSQKRTVLERYFCFYVVEDLFTGKGILEIQFNKINKDLYASFGMLKSRGGGWILTRWVQGFLLAEHAPPHLLQQSNMPNQILFLERGSPGTR